MHARLVHLLWSGVVLTNATAFAQNVFQNLGFENGSVAGYTAFSGVPIGVAMPGWSASISASGLNYDESLVGYDGFSIGGPGVAIWDTNLPSSSPFTPFEGSYSVVLFAGGTIPRYSASISQSGLIPPGTKSLRVDMFWVLESITVSFNGQAINLVPLESYAAYTVYGGDISQFAGQAVELTFTEPPTPPGQPEPSSAVLDDIVFSPSAIPEPSTLGLLWMGLPALLLSRRRDTAK